MRIIAIATLVAASAISFSAVAADAPQGQQIKASTSKQSDLDRVICKGDADTGSRLPVKKTCHTKREWEEIATATRQALDANANHSTGLSSH